MNLSKLRDDIEQVTKKAMSHESHRVIVDVSQLAGWLNVLNNELGTSPRVVDEHSTDMCKVCYKATRINEAEMKKGRNKK